MKKIGEWEVTEHRDGSKSATITDDTGKRWKMSLKPGSLNAILTRLDGGEIENFLPLPKPLLSFFLPCVRHRNKKAPHVAYSFEKMNKKDRAALRAEWPRALTGVF